MPDVWALDDRRTVSLGGVVGVSSGGPCVARGLGDGRPYDSAGRPPTCCLKAGVLGGEGVPRNRPLRSARGMCADRLDGRGGRAARATDSAGCVALAAGGRVRSGLLLYVRTSVLAAASGRWGWRNGLLPTARRAFREWRCGRACMSGLADLFLLQLMLPADSGRPGIWGWLAPSIRSNLHAAFAVRYPN